MISRLHEWWNEAAFTTTTRKLPLPFWIPSWTTPDPRLREISLPSYAAGFISLADLSPAARRTALTGTPRLLDILILCPGIHRQLRDAPELSKGEYPACAALTTGYVFRVENPATVVFLQKIGRTGCLTTVEVSSSTSSSWMMIKGIPDLACAMAGMLTLCAGGILFLLEDWSGMAFLLVLGFVRGVNTLVFRRRMMGLSWKGAAEPGVKGDLLILLSQDRWVRMRGMVDDLKAVTSGEWMREAGVVEKGVVSLATLAMYFNAALAGNVSDLGNWVLVLLLVGSAGLLGLANEYTDVFYMQGRRVKRVGLVKEYPRRRDLADELIRETGRDDWAVRLGMIVREEAKGESEKIM